MIGVCACRQRKRKQFEDNLRRQRANIGAWIKYAEWEESQNEIDRYLIFSRVSIFLFFRSFIHCVSFRMHSARSIWERALEVDARNQTLYMKYAEFEMKNKFVNHARNVFDRAVQLLPRIDQFWYKYAHMEEMLGRIDAARRIYERWMQWAPDEVCYSLRFCVCLCYYSMLSHSAVVVVVVVFIRMHGMPSSNWNCGIRTLKVLGRFMNAVSNVILQYLHIYLGPGLRNSNSMMWLVLALSMNAV